MSTKLVQNATQSREIKFGDFLENIVTKYIEIMGYINLDKSIGVDDDGNALEADQVFCSGDTIYLIEQKYAMTMTAPKSADNTIIFVRSINCSKPLTQTIKSTPPCGLLMMD